MIIIPKLTKADVIVCRGQHFHHGYTVVGPHTYVPCGRLEDARRLAGATAPILCDGEPFCPEGIEHAD